MLNTPSTVANARLTTTHDTENCSQYLLVCEATAPSLSEGTWRFSLESSDGQPVFEAGDTDLGDLNRLTLLAAVRGLESIDGPSWVTLLSHNRYLVRSLSDSLPRWRENNFVWEHFGRRIDVQHADLWRRVDRALSIHRVEACLVSSRLVVPSRLVSFGLIWFDLVCFRPGWFFRSIPFGFVRFGRSIPFGFVRFDLVRSRLVSSRLVVSFDSISFRSV